MVGPADVQLFRTYVAARLGLHYDDDRFDNLAEILARRIESRRTVSVVDYLRELTHHPEGNAEWRVIAAQLSVPESYFFRYANHFQALAEVVLPERMRVQSASRRLRILSAGCASGEEAWSLAMVLREAFPELATWDVKILGLDVNPSVVARAVEGRYGSWSLRETSDARRERWFRTEGRDSVVHADLRTQVAFEERNLVDDDPSFWRPSVFDVVFCRNITMYFTPEATRQVIARITRSLQPSGYLFLGHAETLRAVSQDYHLQHTHDAFYYKLREAGEGTRPRDVQPLPSRIPEYPSRPPIEIAADTPWMEVIKGASDRIAALTHEGTLGLRAAPRAPWDPSVVLELLRAERFTEAMEILHRLPLETQADPDALLLRAVLLTNGGRSTEGLEVCQRLIAMDECNVGAHYLMALCREHAGDRAGAVECDQAAIHLEPGFAMPYLHLGLLARRAGDLVNARSLLGRALVLLAQEDASRVLLYGGGFRREALVHLCRGELKRAGGAA